MAEIESGEKNLLMTKWGPMPVWAWGGIALVLAWIYAKYRSSKASSTSTADTAGSGDSSSETEATAPQFIIENNMPGGGAPSAPVGAPAGPPAPVGPIVTPPTKIPAPPTSTPPHPIVPPAGNGPQPKPAPKPAKKAPIQYKVKTGDNLTTIAAKYHTTAAALWKYNTTPGNRPAATISTLKSRGEDKLYAGETILIPQ